MCRALESNNPIHRVEVHYVVWPTELILVTDFCGNSTLKCIRTDMHMCMYFFITL